LAAKNKKMNASVPPDTSDPQENPKPALKSDQQVCQFPVVGIGASAGGLDAFKRFFAAMPPDSGMAFVLIPHLDPTHRSLMVELLGRQTKMQVCEAATGMPIEADHVYIIPPNKSLSVRDCRLYLSPPPSRQGFPTALDGFFRSLAEDQQERAIGIILSGTGSHGISGMKEIKAVGGLLMVQDPKTAEYDQMPQNALDTGLVDYSLAPEKMPEVLLKYIRHPYLHSPVPLPADDEATDQITPVLELLRTRSRYDFRGYRKKMLIRRTQRRMGICQVEQIADYVAYLRKHPPEVTALGRDFLIGVTSFFRESEAFETLRQRVIADLVEGQSGEMPVRIWVPACATGEEAYSLAILLSEQFALAKKPVNFQIFASDIDGDALDVARKGVYSASAVGELLPERIQKFFVRTDENHFHVNKQLRASIIVTRQNLISDAPFSKLDLISCRNLLIYLEPELQQKIISLFHFALNERGHLFLGCSESIGRQTDLFEPVSKKWRLFQRVPSARHTLIPVPLVSNEHRRIRTSNLEQDFRPQLTSSELMQKLLLARFAPASVLINRKYEVLSLFGRTSDYLELPTGELTRDLMSLLRQGLRTKIRAACHKLLRGSEAVAEIDAHVSRHSSSVHCTISVTLLHEPRDAEGLLLVVFQDRTEDVTPRSAHPITAEEESDVVRHLEHEVESTRDDLQSTIEELHSSSEEVMSMNEELQSANEELETSKEELQSFNEELTTVNSQLQDKVDESERANNDIRNLLNSTEIATVFLDTDLRIRRFTPATFHLLRLIATDIGRSIRDFALRFTDKTLLQDAGRVLDTLEPVETVVHSDEGRYFLRRILPYRTVDNVLEGVVLTFVDLTERMRSETRSRRLDGVLRDSNDAVALLDFKGQIMAWNGGAARLYGYNEEEALKLRISDLVPEDDRAEQQKLLQRISQGEEIKSFETRRLTKSGTLLEIWSTITLLTNDSGHPTAIATTDRDVTERKRTEHALAESERRMRAVVETASDAIITISARGNIDSFNPAAERMFGYSQTEAIGQDVRILMPTSERDDHETFIAHYFKKGDASIIGLGRELLGRRKDASMFPIDMAVSELHEGVDHTFTGIIRDISERKSLQRELLTIASEEKRRISQDLHDSVGQKLTGLGMLAGSLAETLKEHSPVDVEAASRIAMGVENALDQIRKLSIGLLPVEVDAEGLRAALTDLADITTHDSGINCEFVCNESVPVEDSETATHLYRIAQEATANALKHGAPENVMISLSKNAHQVILSIHDDGKGFSSTALQSHGMGLKTMQYRAALIGATLSIIRNKEGGMLVTCALVQN
jgi:two-component system CheB/CheR fusion protein